MSMQFKVPQNVQMADKIIGPLTIAQFLYFLGGAFLTFMAYSISKNGSVTVFAAIIFGGAAAAFAFGRPNDQPFQVWLFSLMAFLSKPRQFVWRKELDKEDKTIIGEVKKEDVATPIMAEKLQKKSQLTELAHIVDTKGWSNEDPEMVLRQNPYAVPEDATKLEGRVTSTSSSKPDLNLNIDPHDSIEDTIETAEKEGADLKPFNRLLNTSIKRGSQNHIEASKMSKEVQKGHPAGINHVKDLFKSHHKE